MKIFIKTPVGRTISLIVDPTSTVVGVKQMIQGFEGLPSDQQRLNFAGTQLEDERALSDYKIGEESMIQLAIPFSSNFDISVRTAGGDSFVVTISPEYLIMRIKINLQQQIGIPVEHQLLVSSGKTLGDGLRIKDCNLNSRSTVWLRTINDPVKCQICMQDFEIEGDMAPHGLVCGHSFCHRDIVDLIGERDIIACPTCRHTVSLNVYSDGFPARNEPLLSALSRVQELRGPKDESVSICSNCAGHQSPATVFCIVCEVDFCDACDQQVHALKVFQRHKRTSLTEKPPPVLVCTVHREKMQRFCIDCQEWVCMNCVEIDGDHHGHNNRLSTVISEESKSTIKCQVSQSFDHFCHLQQLSAELITMQATLAANEEACLEAFRADTATLFSTLRSRCDALENKLRDGIQARRQDLSERHKRTLHNMWFADSLSREAEVALILEDTKLLGAIRSVTRRLDGSNQTSYDFLSRAELPSVAADYAKAEEGPHGLHVAPLLEAIEQFDLELLPLVHPRIAFPFFHSACAVFGTGELGDLVVQGVVTVPAGELLQYTNVTVCSGGRFTVAAWDGTTGGMLRLYVLCRLHIEEGGCIDLSGLGYPGGKSNSFGEKSGFPCLGAGGTNGGGGSGGAGGAGGGGLLIHARNFLNLGAVRCNGDAGRPGGYNSYGGGGGNGGSIKIVSNTFHGIGVICAVGGTKGQSSPNYYNSSYAISGAVGRIRLETADISMPRSRTGAADSVAGGGADGWVGAADQRDATELDWSRVFPEPSVGAYEVSNAEN